MAANRAIVATLALFWTTVLVPPAHATRAEIGGYFRVMTRPDLQGGDGRLGYWNLYGRLLNEGPYAAFETKIHLLERIPGSDAIWTSAHVKLEGGTVGNTEPTNGSLADWRLSRLYVLAGNVALRDVTWQLGTLEYVFGDLGLYDMRIAQIFTDAVGLSGRYEGDRLTVLAGVGDAGYALRGADYDTVLNPGGALRLRLGDHVSLGAGTEFFFQAETPGNRHAPHTTPALSLEDVLRGEVIASWIQDNPGQDPETSFPTPEPTSVSARKVVGHLGFGDFGPLLWNNAFVSFQTLLPENAISETYTDPATGETWDLDYYVTELTDERTRLDLGNEITLTLWPGHLDAVWGILYGQYTDGDNDIAPSDHARTFTSTVLRLQHYVTPGIHLLVEGSLAREVSTNGNAYREHKDSIFETSDGRTSDPDGLQSGDTDTRETFQGKGGVVLSPLGPGVWTRPSIRLLYGVQLSNQNNAFGNSFVETLDQYNQFGNVERHVHHVGALEAEVWF